MTKKDRSKIGGIKSTRGSSEVEKTSSVDESSKVKKVTRVGGISRAGSVQNRKQTKVMTTAERDKLFRIINEEAEKMFGSDSVIKEKKEIVATAVKMAVDAGLLDEEGAEEIVGKKK